MKISPVEMNISSVGVISPVRMNISSVGVISPVRMNISLVGMNISPVSGVLFLVVKN
jgi:hypothetical protein